MVATQEEIRRTADGPSQESAKAARWKRRGSVYLARLGIMVVLIGAWEWTVNAGRADPFYVSSPSRVVDALSRLLVSGELYENLLATAIATTMGFLIGAAIGIVGGLILGSSPFLDKVIAPYLAIGNSMPRIALAPLFILWFGLSMWAKAWLAVTLVVFIMLYNTRGGVQTVDPDHLVLSHMLDMSRLERFRKVVLPTAIPAIMAGLRLSVVFSLLGVIASEMIASRDGLGQMAIAASATFRVGELIAVLLVIAAMAVAMNSGLDVFERLVVRWKADPR